MKICANELRVGDTFTTEADDGRVWYVVEEIESSPRPLLNVLGRVVDVLGAEDYAVGDSEWMDLEPTENVQVRR